MLTCSKTVESMMHSLCSYYGIIKESRIVIKLSVLTSSRIASQRVENKDSDSIMYWHKTILLFNICSRNILGTIDLTHDPTKSKPGKNIARKRNADHRRVIPVSKLVTDQSVN